MNDSSPPRFGIVLSGGGTRGLAHVGVLRALLEHELVPDAVAGCSSGALVGALYAAGYTTDAMVEFFEQRNPFHVRKLALAGPGFFDTGKVRSDFEDYFPDDRFEALSVPLRVLATDLIGGTAAVFDSGPLIPAILASCAVPVVFTPPEIDGRWFADGGIIDNFPVDLLRGRCRMLLGVYASPPRRIAREDLGSSLAVFQRALEVGMFNHSSKRFDRCDVMICPDTLSRFGVFDTRHMREIEEVGYKAGVAAIDRVREALEKVA